MCRAPSAPPSSSRTTPAFGRGSIPRAWPSMANWPVSSPTSVKKKAGKLKNCILVKGGWTKCSAPLLCPSRRRRKRYEFLGSWAFLALSLALTFPVWISVRFLGHPDNGVIFCAYIGSLLLAGSYLAIGCLTSAITRNQVISFILSVVICLFLILAGWPPVTDLLVQWAPAWLVDTVARFSVISHFDGLRMWVIDLRDLIWFASVIGFALFPTGVVIR